MNNILKKYINHYQIIFLYTIILFASGFILVLGLNLFHQPVLLLINKFYNQIINIELIQSYLYFMICLILIIIFSSFHIFGIILIGLITFLLGIHNGNYCYIMFNLHLPILKLFYEILFLLFQSSCLIVAIIGAVEMSINVFAVSFLFNERLKSSDLIHHCLNFLFISFTILFISIILKIYLN